MVKKVTLPWEPNPGPTPIRGDLATLIASVGLKNKSNTYKNIKCCIVRFALVRVVDHFWEEEWWAGPE